MPFGLTNAPATFQRTMDQTFADMTDFTDIYVDDIVVYSATLEEHLVHLSKVLQRLREHQLFVKRKKCSFAQHEIEFVGFIVGSDGIRPMPEKLQTVADWPTPRNPKHVRSFLGLCCFYHHFFPQFATLASPGRTSLGAWATRATCFRRDQAASF